MGTHKDSEKTRAKLIEAAGRLFAEKGYNGVTVRNIARAADTHLSALNYHFRSKEALYHEVIVEACKADSISLENKKLLLRFSPCEALFLLVKKLLNEYQKQTTFNWRIILITRECRQPSREFDEISRGYIKSETDFLAQLIAKAVNKPSTDHHVRFAVMSLIALLETFGHYGHLINAVSPGLEDSFHQHNGLAKHIVHLVLTAAVPSVKEVVHEN